MIYEIFVGASPTTTELQSFKAEFFKALAHPIRIRILELLRGHERGVRELQAALDLDQSTVSQQLAVLRAKNVVVASREGTAVRYAIRDESVGELLDAARRIFNNQLVGTQTLLRALRREARRAGRRCPVLPQRRMALRTWVATEPAPARSVVERVGARVAGEMPRRFGRSLTIGGGAPR